MAINYNPTPIEILKLLGLTKPAAANELENYEQENNLKLPAILFDFLSLTRNNPLFSTADIWTQDDFFPYFSYQYIEEGIEDCRQDWEDDPEFGEENDFYPFSKIPKEKWSESVANYLQIGSDYGAGVAFFGIEDNDLMKADPPVYMLHEADPLTDWKLIFPTLTNYLMGILFDVLTCVAYKTAQYVLDKEGWKYYHYEYANQEEAKKQFAQTGIELSAMKKYKSCYDIESFFRCCLDEEEKALYFIVNDQSYLLIKSE